VGSLGTATQCLPGAQGRIAQFQELPDFTSAPRPMKMGTIRSRFLDDVAAMRSSRRVYGVLRSSTHLKSPVTPQQRVRAAFGMNVMGQKLTFVGMTSIQNPKRRCESEHLPNRLRAESRRSK
jgi:hypothetical protein